MTVEVPEVIELLESYLKEARNHRFGHVAISLVGHPNIAALDFAGDIKLEMAQREALGMLDAKLRRSIDNWSFPPQDKTLDASYVRYNIANGPLGYDFLVWLVTAEMTRVREGAPAPLKVGFWCGRDAVQRVNTDRRQQWLDKVFRPCLRFIGAVEDPGAIFGRCDEIFVARAIVAAVLRGETVPRLHAPEWAGKKGAVTITLREAGHSSFRNSNVAEWLKAAGVLSSRGESVIFVRDTANAHAPLPGFVTSPKAALDINVRLALYENAKANLFVANGPYGLALFGSRPFLAFHSQNEACEEVCNTAKFWEENQGIALGAQYPWSRPDQRLIWKPDTCDNIMASWDELGA